MDQKKQRGLLLFPQPPTPPARRRRATTVSTNSSLSGSIKSVKKGLGHGRKVSTSVADQTQPGLVPAPLKVRKTAEDRPPVPTLLPALDTTTPTKTRVDFDAGPKTPSGSSTQVPAIHQISPTSPSPRTPARNGNRLDPRTIAELVELDAGFEQKDSKRLSQWLDLEDGQVDQRRLSKYLGSVLGSTFEVPNLDSRRRESLAVLRRMSRQELQSLVEQYEQEQCECPPDTVICQCSSSPEFEHFRNWASHKQNSSISSTVCFLGVPRARFHPALFDVQPTIAELPSPQMSSPPGLSYDTGDHSSESGDWTSPRTPSSHDIFTERSPRRKSYSSKCVIHYASPPSPSTPSKLQSFSRPFRPDSTYRCLSSKDSAPSTPTRRPHKSSEMKKQFLTSISTLSSFDFDFDINARRNSLAQHKLRAQSFAEREDSNHSRTSSGETSASDTSQYEVSTATAAVTTSRSTFKPTLVTNAGRRAKTPQSFARLKGSVSTTSSAKSSTSSFSIPEYWHKYHANLRPRSRSMTKGSKDSTTSNTLSLLLTMPLLSPKKIEPTYSSSPGNAFAQRSNTTATMPSKLPSTVEELSQFDFGTVSNESKQTLTRSKTIPPNVTYSARPEDKGVEHVAVLDTGSEDTTDPRHDDGGNDSEDFNDHVQAYRSAHARFKAYMEHQTQTATSAPTTSPAPASSQFPFLKMTESESLFDDNDNDHYNSDNDNSTSGFHDYDHDNLSPSELKTWTGLGMVSSLSTTSSNRSTQNYTNTHTYTETHTHEGNDNENTTNDQHPHRDRMDSGVFGRMSILGSAAPLVGGRNISEPLTQSSLGRHMYW